MAQKVALQFNRPRCSDCQCSLSLTGCRARNSPAKARACWRARGIPSPLRSARYGGNPRIRFGFPLVELPLRVLPFRVGGRVEFRLEGGAVQASVLFPHVARETLASFVISPAVST